MRKNIFAYTEASAPSYPGYISVNQEEDGRHTVAVRNRGQGGNTVAVIEMNPDELEALARGIFAHLGVDLSMADLSQTFDKARVKAAADAKAKK